jgi:uncharacterized repeat protein (TIGR01451 family)
MSMTSALTAGTFALALPAHAGDGARPVSATQIQAQLSGHRPLSTGQAQQYLAGSSGSTAERAVTPQSGVGEPAQGDFGTGKFLEGEADPEPSVYGQSVTYQAEFAFSDGPPAGCVTFEAEGNPTPLGLDCDPATEYGILATYSVSHAGLAPGTYTIDATYLPGPGEPPGRSSGSFSHEVDKATVKGHLSAAPNPADHGATVTFHATVTPTTNAGVPPKGTVSFSSGGQHLCTTPTLSPTGTANSAKGKCTSAALPAGQNTITAAYSGDDNYQPRKARFTENVTPLANGEVSVTGDANLNRSGNQSSRTGNGLVSYTVKVTNNGPDAAENVTVSDVLPSTATGPRGRSVLAEFISDTGNCSGEPRPYTASHGQTVTCSLGTIAPKSSKSVTFTFALFSRSRARSPYPFTFTDSASAHSSTKGTLGKGSATLTYYMR